MSGPISRRTVLATALPLLCTFPLLGLRPVPARASATVIQVGAYEFPPYVDETGGGITRDLLELLNGAQGEFRFEMVRTAPQRRYEDLDQGRFDMIAFESRNWGWQDRPVDATRPFLRDAEVFIARATPGIDQRYFDDLGGKTILGRLGYHYAFAGFDADPKRLEQRYRTRVTVTHEGNVRSVVAGRADLAIVTRSFLTRFLQREPELARQVLVSDRTDQIYEHTILIRQGAALTTGWLNGLLDRLEADGRLEALWRRSGISS
ncbi:transporter substrate-binding domain-containing protein [Azospirillum melinis]|uniref:Transporter substrate-binding domain-containing protein n=1 Tax=Azospirillum melinis TaxID=328839 RepID=A0ABX2K498_9PROT|nr:ABC transporter substrate-binding protein [Azospirillum melinis]MBP2304015.1 ABC-type amino acid transport substrate-binding protein [Azospirillum melinis]NUA98381.1 transporter substrate-binding domain-containing protein [Azospirillum melinis]